MIYSKFPLSRKREGILLTFIILGYILFFLVGIMLSKNGGFNVTDIDYEMKTTEILKVSVMDYVKTNITVYTIIFFGFVTLGTLSVIVLVYNALIIGYYFGAAFYATQELTKVLLLTFTHCAEYIGFIFACYYSLVITKNVLFYKINDNEISINFLLIFKIYLKGSLFIIIGAICETYFTPLFL